MKKVFLIGKLNEILKELGELLSSKSCQVQLCPDDQEHVQGMLKMIVPNVAVISLVGSRTAHEDLISLLLRDCPGINVVIVGSRANENDLEEDGYLSRPLVHFIRRPVTTREIVRQINGILSTVSSSPAPAPEAKPEPETGPEPEAEPEETEPEETEPEETEPEPEAEPEEELETESTPQAKGPKTILVVDDSPIMLRTMQAMLSKRYRVIFAVSGTQAIALTARERPDLILLDYEMPVINGKMTLEMLRSDESTKDIPVVFLTGMDDAAHVHEVVALRPQGYLLKPPSEERIFSTIEEILNRK